MKLSRKLKISTKLTGGFAVVAMICAVVGAVGWSGVNSLQKNITVVAEERLPAVLALGIMTESMNAIESAERTMVNASLTGEERRLELGNLQNRWAAFAKGHENYASLPKTAAEEGLWQKLGPAIDVWEKEHKKLVDNTAGIKLDNPGSLEAILVARELDHIKWISGLDMAIAESEEFTGQQDATLCGLGKWMNGFKSGDKDFDAIIDKFQAPHTKLHAFGGQINEMIFMNNFSDMGESLEARELFDNEIAATLAEIMSIFDEALTYSRADMARLAAAQEIAFGSEREAFAATMDLFNELAALSVRLSEEASLASQTSARNSKVTAAVAVAFGVVLAVLFGFFLSRNITVPLNSTIEVIRKIGLGDTSDSLPAGEGVNCSQIKNCGNETCPSYGKVDVCWVHAGSFAPVKHCPRAKKGEDCRTCDLYGAKTELDELGAIVMGLSNGLAEREDLALAIAKGDLTKDVELTSDKDGLGKALRIMTTSLSGIIGQVKTASEQIDGGASQVSDSSQSLSQGATESAASLEQITASMSEMASQTKISAENAGQANQLSNDAKGVAESGNNQMQDMVVAMEEINESSQSISKIIKVIDEIAFQTNLLALNAAVEAARAGKHGKGFAVVAEEVRNLAARSAKAAKETADLIEGSVNRTKHGGEIASKTAQALGEIVVGITKVSDLVAEIAAASNEQAEGISQVNNGLGQIDSVTQQNTANAEESAAAAEELSGQAGQLMSLLSSRFKLNDTREAAVDAAPQPAALDWSPEPAAGSEMVENIQPEPAPQEVIALDDTEFGRY
jgi:methyl-accepting chemotaxis protein